MHSFIYGMVWAISDAIEMKIVKQNSYAIDVLQYLTIDHVSIQIMGRRQQVSYVEPFTW